LSESELKGEGTKGRKDEGNKGHGTRDKERGKRHERKREGTGDKEKGRRHERAKGIKHK
jgi:hypothetical protein